MIVCPVALAVGCKKCPVFSICPVKSVIGDYHPGDDKAAANMGAGSAAGKTRK